MVFSAQRFPCIVATCPLGTRSELAADLLISGVAGFIVATVPVALLQRLMQYLWFRVGLAFVTSPDIFDVPRIASASVLLKLWVRVTFPSSRFVSEAHCEERCINYTANTHLRSCDGLFVGL